MKGSPSTSSHEALGVHQFLGGHHLLGLPKLAARRGEQHLALRLQVGIADVDFQEETVELRLR